MVGTFFSWGTLVNTLACRAEYGASWWEHVLPAADEFVVVDSAALEVLSFFGYGAALWTLVLAMVFDAYLPAYYMYNALCVA